MAQANRIQETTFLQDVCFRVLSKQQATKLPHNFMPYFLATGELLSNECVDDATIMKIAIDTYIDIASIEGFEIKISHLKRTA